MDGMGFSQTDLSLGVSNKRQMGDLVHLHSELFSQDLHPQWVALRSWLKTRSTELGFADLKITDTDVSEAHPRVLDWIEQGRHGAMQFFERHQELRANPNALQPGALRSICLTMPYLHPQPSVTTDSAFAQSDASSLEALIEREQARLLQPDQAVVSVYARGRDYHKVPQSSSLLSLTRCVRLSQKLGFQASPFQR